MFASPKIDMKWLYAESSTDSRNTQISARSKFSFPDSVSSVSMESQGPSLSNYSESVSSRHTGIVSVDMTSLSTPHQSQGSRRNLDVVVADDGKFQQFDAKLLLNIFRSREFATTRHGFS